MRPISVFILLVALAACDSSSTPPPPTTAPPEEPTTTTTILGDTCEQLAVDMAGYLEVVVSVLNETTLVEFRDRDSWPEALVALQRQGNDLDSRAAAMRCDRAQLQEGAFFGADVEPAGPIAEMLFELWGRE